VGVIGTVLAGWLLLNGLMFLAQPGMIFYPSSRLDATPRDWGLDYQDVWLETEDGLRLHGWYIPHTGSERVLLFFHGNAGNISHRGESVAIFHRLGLSVLIIDYRGYGRSEGAPSEDGLTRDARAAWQWLTVDQGVDAARILLFGRSLGATVAANLAGETRPGGVILESGFSSARDAANALFPVLSRLVILRYRLDAAGALAGASSPILVLHSPDDEIIPYHLGRRLYDAAPEPKRFVDLRGGHNDGFLRSQPDYERAFGAFLTSLEPSRGQR
jgi:fermentation-respiration switch protein FrsA (DUF1100 family)